MSLPTSNRFFAARDLADWLIADGRMAADAEALVAGFADGMRRSGAPVDRLVVTMPVLHPQLRGFTLEWRSDRRHVLRTPRDRSITASPAYLRSPIHQIQDLGLPRLRYRLSDPLPTPPVLLLEELRSEGMTDYAAHALTLSSGQRITASYATRDPQGFDASDVLEAIEPVLPLLAMALEPHMHRGTLRELLEVYLGREAGRRVADGAVERGAGDVIRAVVWLCDLRSFTALADRLALQPLIEVLNQAFGIMGRAVTTGGGDILKFVGDAVLAIFRLDDGRDETDVVRAACMAAMRVQADLDRLAIPAESGLPGLGARIALHAGEVMYGNVGAPDRLDFTVIGPAVNLAARLERLARDLKEPIVASDELRRLCRTDGLMRPLGDFALDGVADPVSVYAVPLQPIDG